MVSKIGKRGSGAQRRPGSRKLEFVSRAAVSSRTGAVERLLPYENLTNMPARTAVARAETVLAEGWAHGGKYAVLHLDQTIPWDDDSPEKRSWNFHIQCLDMIHDLLHAYSESGQDRFLTVALEVALDWVRTHPEPSTPGISQFAWYDMAVGLRSQRLAYLLDVASCNADQHVETCELLERSLEHHREYLSLDSNIAFHSNHGFYQVAGQLAMARRFAGRLPKMDEAYRQGAKRLHRMVDQQFTQEGVHREHSPDYHRMVYESLNGILSAGLLDDGDLLQIAGKIEDSLAWFVFPNGVLVNFGDSDSRDMVRTAAEAKERWRGAAMRFVASAGEIGNAPTSRTQAFEDGGYWIARSRWERGAGESPEDGYLALNAAFHSRTHKHADDLSFVWYDRGEELLVDAGRYGYLGKTEAGSDLWNQGYWYSDPKRMYVESTRAHNAVEIDGRDYVRKGVKPYGSALGRHGTSRGNIHFCEAEVRHFGSIRHARVLVWATGQWLLVFDWLHDNAEEPHQFTQWLHLHPGLSAFASGNGFVSLPRRSATALRIVSLLPGVHALRPELAQELPRLQGFHSAKEKSLVPNYALGFRAEGSQGVGIATLLAFGEVVEPDHKSSEMAASGRKLRLRWSTDGVAHSLILSRPAGEPIKISYDRT